MSVQSEKPRLQLHDFRFRAMNTEVSAVLQVRPGQDRALLEHETIDWFRHAESVFSRFRPDSELTQINRLAGSGPVLLSETMLEVLLLAEQYHALTDGAFNPLIGGALRRLGYDRSYEQLAAVGTPAASDTAAAGIGVFLPAASVDPVAPLVAVAPTDPWPLQLDPRMKSARLPASVELDLGGIVKSWTVSRAARWLQTAFGVNVGLLNAGGDLTAWSDSTHSASPWEIGIEDPWCPDRDMGSILLGAGSAGTSSRLGRHWTTQQGDKHHLIDPGTLDSAQSDIVQCTVLGPDPIACEIWSKALCILGAGRGGALFHTRAAGYEALWFFEDGTYGGTASLLARLTLLFEPIHNTH